MWKEIANGGPLDLYSGMRYYDQFIPEGSKVLCQFNLRTSLSPTTVNSLEQKMKDAGVTDARVTTGSPILNVEFTKGFPWLATIVAVILIIVALIISWRFFIWIEETAPGGTKFILWGGLGLVAVLLLREITKTKREFVGGSK